jgi:DNA-binding CsgD family transcriptional regulator/tetratricopeptide (TPR) repeat protein
MLGEHDRDLSAQAIAGARTTQQLALLLRRLRRRDARGRGAAEVTYRQLAADTGWSHAAIGEYFTGRTLPPTDRFDVLIRMLGAAPAEQRLLATARDRIEDHQRGSGARPVATGGVRLGGAPVVGREAELTVLRSAVDAATRGRGGAVFLIGEAGIGKTRLAVEAARYADAAGLRVLRGRAAAPAVQFRPFAEALLAVSRRSGPPADPDLAPYRPALARLVPEWAAERTAAADDSIVVLAEGVLRLLVAVGRPRGAVLVLEDLHDADTDSLAVVDYLVDNAASEPLLVVGTARPEQGRALDLVRGVRSRRSGTVAELGRLAHPAVRQLAAGCLGVPAGEVPEAVLDRLSAASDGIPLHAEELLAGMVGNRVLVRDGGRWVVQGPVGAAVPASLTATLAGRLDRLNPATRAVLRAAALIGRDFPLRTAGAAAGVDGDELLSCVREAVDAQILVADGGDYSFRHALTAEAVRARLLPADRARLSRRVAQAVEDSSVDGWERLAAELWCAAGDHRRAAELFGVAGRRAAAAGAIATAIGLLERALALLDAGSVADPLAATLAEALVDAYADSGRIEDARAIGARFERQLEPSWRAGVHLRLAGAAAAAGLWAEGLGELAKARRAFGPTADPAVAARMDAVGARLTFGDPSPRRVRTARALAERALRAAEATAQPDVVCSALEMLGRCVRLSDLAEADTLYRRGLAVAEANGLVGRKIRLLYHLGGHEGARRAEPYGLRHALDVATEAGAVVSALSIETELAIVQLCRGEHEAAERAIRRCEETAERLRLSHARLIALGVRVCVAAHRARRAETEALLSRYLDLGGVANDFTSAVRGFGLAIGLLLDEDRAGALAEARQAVAAEASRPVPFLSYTPGPHLLLAVLDGEAGAEECRALARSAQAQTGWNRLFLDLAVAVRHGRAGNRVRAERAMAGFVGRSAGYPLAHHLGLRLVAQAAIDNGWGEPVDWLRAAEAYFHPAAPKVARACRDLLRRAGAAVPQHRQGSETIPWTLRQRGITVREHEVLCLVAERLTNVEIGRRLFLSPRTVERHIAGLLAKTGCPDRAQLADLAGKALASETLASEAVADKVG